MFNVIAMKKSSQGAPPPPLVTENGDRLKIDFLLKISEFIEFVGLRNHRNIDVLRFLTMTTLNEMNATCVLVSELEENGKVRISGLFGHKAEAFAHFPELESLHDQMPIAEVLRLRRMVWINTLPVWPEEYPTLKDLKLPADEKTAISFPIDKFGTPVGSMTILSSAVIQPNVEIQAFLRAIGSVYSLYLFKDDLEDRIREAAESIVNNRIKGPINGEKSGHISDRQLVILKLISQGLTNIEISELIGYSDSTVRQESVRIFALLGCTNRRDAGRIYNEKYKESTEALA